MMYNQPPQGRPAQMALAPQQLKMIKLVLGGLIILLALIMLIGFFAASWLEDESFKSDDNEDGTVSAWEIWIGKIGDEEGTLDFGKYEEADDGEDVGGFGDVRGLDRLLILIPLLALGLIALAVVYMLDMMPAMMSLTGLAILAFILFVFPFLWQAMSTSNWKGDIEDTFKGYGLDDDDLDKYVDDAIDELTDSYSTGQLKLFGFLALLASLGGIGLEFALSRGMIASGGYPPGGAPPWEAPPGSPPPGY